MSWSASTLLFVSDAGVAADFYGLLAKGVAIKDGWWGEQLMIVEDPDGNQLRFEPIRAILGEISPRARQDKRQRRR